MLSHPALSIEFLVSMLKNYYYFASKNYHFLLFGLLTAFFGNYGQSFFIAWFGNSFLQDFSLSNAEYGLIYSSATFVSGIIILFVGAMLDKTPLKKFTLVTSGCLAGACFMLYFAQEIWHLLLALFLLRLCGQGLMFHIAFTSMARYFHQNRGKAIGIVGFGMPIGEAILPAIAVGLIATIGWRETWLVAGMAILILFWPLMNYLLNHSDRYHQQQPEESTSQQKAIPSWTRKQVVSDYRFWLLIPMVMFPAFSMTGIFIHQSVLLTSKNWSEGWFAICFTLYGFTHLLGSLVIGNLVDRYSGKKLVQFYLLPLFLGIGLLATPFDHSIIAALFMLLAGITIGASGPVVGSLWVEIYGNEFIGAIRSMVTAIMVVSTAIAPVLFGWFFDQGLSYQSVAIFLLGYLFLAWSGIKWLVLKAIE